MTARLIATALLGLMLALPTGALAHEIGFQREGPAHAEKQHAEGEEDIEAHMEEILERELAPIRAELKEIHAELERPGLAEIAGGIGWIVGILGFIAYLKSRKK